MVPKNIKNDQMKVGDFFLPKTFLFLEYEYIAYLPDLDPCDLASSLL
jgi:hypothetical protein